MEQQLIISHLMHTQFFYALTPRVRFTDSVQIADRFKSGSRCPRGVEADWFWIIGLMV